MMFVARNFWRACEESWPEFFLFLGVLCCGIAGLLVSLRVILELGSGPEVPITVLMVFYLLWAHWRNIKERKDG